MAKTREQMLQEQLGALTFQNAILAADLEAARERIKALESAQSDAKTDANRSN